MANGSGRKLRTWARLQRRAQSFIYKTKPQAPPAVTLNWFFDSPPIGSASGTSTVTAVGTALAVAIGNNADGVATAVATGASVFAATATAAGTSGSSVVGLQASTAVASTSGVATAVAIASGPGGIMPSIYEDGAGVHGTGALSVPWGTHNNTFTSLLVITSNGETIGQPTSADATWDLIAECYVGTPGAAGSVGIAAYWAHAVSGTMANVTVPDSGDHTSAKMFMLRDITHDGPPINFAETQTVSTATASISFACPSSTVPNCLVFCLAGHGIDTGTPPGGSGWANASLANIGFAGQYTTTNGNGGGYMGGVGQKVSAGACGTFTHTWAGGATKQANIVLAISNSPTIQDTGAASAAGTSTATATSEVTFAAVASSAGVATTSFVGADGFVASANGTSTATAVGIGIVTSTASTSGSSTGTASSTEFRIVNVTSNPQTIAWGSWTYTAFENGKWKVQVTPTFDSANAAYSPFKGIVTSGSPAGGWGLWMASASFRIYDLDDIPSVSVAATWSAGQNITLLVDIIGGSLTISGATTGNGVHNFTPSPPYWETSSSLFVGGWNNTASWDWAGAVGSIYAVVDNATASSTGSTTSAATGTSTAVAVGSAAGVATATAAGTYINAIVSLGAHGMDSTINAVEQNTNLEVALNTQASNSFFLVAHAGQNSDVTQGITDSLTNTWTLYGSHYTYADWSGYGASFRYAYPGSGGTGQNFVGQHADFSEGTMFVLELIGAKRIYSFSRIDDPNAGAGTTLTSGSVSTIGPSMLVAYWYGAAPVIPGEVPFTADPNNGFTVLHSELRNHPNGQLQAAVAVKYVNTEGTYDVTWTHSPAQGAQLMLFALDPAIIYGVAASSGTSTATAASNAIIAVDAAASGTSTVNGVASSGEGIASSTGSSTASAVGSSLFAGQVSSAGTASVAGTGQSQTLGIAVSAGTVLSLGVGSSTGASETGAAGTSTVTATGAATFRGDAASTASSTTSGVGAALSTALASAPGSTSATATGAAIFRGDALVDGTSTTSAAGAATFVATASSTGAATSEATGVASSVASGLSQGLTTATAAGLSTSSAQGNVVGTSTSTFYGSSEARSVGGSAGSSTTATIGASLAEAVGSAVGQSSVSAFARVDVISEGTSTALAVGASLAVSSIASSGLSTATALAVAYANATVSSVGLSTAIATGRGFGLAAGSSVGTSSATAGGQSVTETVAASAGTSTASATGVPLYLTVGTSASTATATASGRATAASQGLSTGSTISAGTGRAFVGAAGASSSTSTTAAVGSYIFTGTGSSTGSSVIDFVGRAVFQGIGVSSGLAAAVAAGATRIATQGLAQGLASTSATGGSVAASLFSENGTATALTAGLSIFSAVAECNGSSTAILYGFGTSPALGQTAGWSAANALGEAISKAVGLSQGSFQVLGFGRALYPPGYPLAPAISSFQQTTPAVLTSSQGSVTPETPRIMPTATTSVSAPSISRKRRG